MRQLATVQRIAEIKTIPEADAIDAYRINGWWVIDKKGAYTVGDLVVYCEPDSWVPHDLAPFLSKNNTPRVFRNVCGERLRTIKLRGQLSQGLILPFMSVQEGSEEGSDVTEILGIIKWEAPEEGSLGGDSKSTLPSFFPRTDQPRIQNLGKTLDSLWGAQNWQWEVTEKLEGSSFTCYYFNGDVGVCSRERDLFDTPLNVFWKVAKKYNLPEILTQFAGNIAIQGELVGPKVCGNIYKLSEFDLYVYDIYDINKGEYFLPEDRWAMCEAFGLQHAPVLHTCYTTNSSTTVDSLLTLADGTCIVGTPTLREGLVFKSLTHQTSFKAVSNEYLIKQGKKR